VIETKSCTGCGAALDSDQRYCLNCGRRCGERRIDFRRYHAEVPQSEEPAQPAPEKPQRDLAPLAAAGGIAVLGLMLLVGVLIGRGDGGEQTAAPAPQVVRVQGGGDGEATGNEEGGALGAATGGGRKPKKGERGKGGGEAAAPPPAAITADDSELEALQGKSPQEYSEASAKLPDEIATEGKPPPEDDKKPGGGSGGTTIE